MVTHQHKELTCDDIMTQWARYYIWYEYIEVHSPMIKYIKDLKNVNADTCLSLGRNEP